MACSGSSFQKEPTSHSSRSPHWMPSRLYSMDDFARPQAGRRLAKPRMQCCVDSLRRSAVTIITRACVEEQQGNVDPPAFRKKRERRLETVALAVLETVPGAGVIWANLQPVQRRVNSSAILAPKLKKERGITAGVTSPRS